MSILRRILVRLRRRLSPDYKGFRTLTRAMRKAKPENFVMGGSGCGKAMAAIEPFYSSDRCIFCGEIVPEGRIVCPNCEKELW